MAHLEQVLRVQPAAELLGQVGGVLSAGVEGKQAVQVGEDRRAQVPGALGVGQPVQPDSVWVARTMLAPYLASSPSTCS